MLHTYNWYLSYAQLNKLAHIKIVIFSVSLNMFFGCSNEPSHRDMYWFQNKIRPSYHFLDWTISASNVKLSCDASSPTLSSESTEFETLWFSKVCSRDKSAIDSLSSPLVLVVSLVLVVTSGSKVDVSSLIKGPNCSSSSIEAIKSWSLAAS